jgi:hypothetical protein
VNRDFTLLLNQCIDSQLLGREVEVRARKGVVLAAGGFPQSAHRRAQLFPHDPTGSEHHSPAPPGNTGDGLALAESVGGKVATELPTPVHGSRYAGSPSRWRCSKASITLTKAGKVLVGALPNCCRWPRHAGGADQSAFFSQSSTSFAALRRMSKCPLISANFTGLLMGNLTLSLA